MSGEHDEHDDEQLPPLSPAAEAEVAAALHVQGGMPADVWLRLERAILDESAHREQGLGEDTGPRGRSRARTAGIFGLAAAVALVVGGTVIATVDRQQGGEGPAPVAAGAPATGAAMVLASGTDYQPQTLAEQVKRTVADVRGRMRLAAGPDASMPGMSPSEMPGMSPMSSLAATQAPLAMPAGMPADMPFLEDTEHFQGCLHHLVPVPADDDVAVLLVDIATLRGTVTAIIVIPATEMPPSMGVDPALEQIFVVTPGCTMTEHAQVDLDAA